MSNKINNDYSCNYNYNAVTQQEEFEYTYKAKSSPVKQESFLVARETLLNRCARLLRNGFFA